MDIIYLPFVALIGIALFMFGTILATLLILGVMIGILRANRSILRRMNYRHTWLTGTLVIIPIISGIVITISLFIEEMFSPRTFDVAQAAGQTAPFFLAGIVIAIALECVMVIVSQRTKLKE